jgi:hypothetical protein
LDKLNFHCTEPRHEGQIIVEPINAIHKDCPLQDALSRDEAITKITVGLMCTGMSPVKAKGIAVEIANLLGFRG